MMDRQARASEPIRGAQTRERGVPREVELEILRVEGLVGRDRLDEGLQFAGDLVRQRLHSVQGL
jgi:hypothetical protein